MNKSLVLAVVLAVGLGVPLGFSLTRLSQSQRGYEEMAQSKNDLQKNYDGLYERAAGLDAELGDLKLENVELRNELGRAKGETKLESVKTSSQVERLQSMISQRESELSKTKAALASAQSMISQRESELSKTKAALASAQSQIQTKKTVFPSYVEMKDLARDVGGTFQPSQITDCDDYAVEYYVRARDKNWEVYVVLWEVEYLGGHALNMVRGNDGELRLVEPQGIVDVPTTGRNEVIEAWTEHLTKQYLKLSTALFPKLLPTELQGEFNVIGPSYAHTDIVEISMPRNILDTIKNKIMNALRRILPGNTVTDEYGNVYTASIDASTITLEDLYGINDNTWNAISDDVSSSMLSSEEGRAINTALYGAFEKSYQRTSTSV